MTGRDPSEPHRASTPLELLFDLTLAIAFGQAGAQMAHMLAPVVVIVGYETIGHRRQAVAIERAVA